MSPGRALLAVSGWIALAATLLPAAGAARIVVTLAFLLLGPGAALVGLRRRLSAGVAPDAGEDRTLAVVLSVCLATLVSEGLYLGHLYSTPRAMSLLAGITTVAAVWPGRRAVSAARRGRSRPT